MQPMTIYDFEARKPSGEVLQFSDYKGSPILIVNTATKCGLAPQFEELEALHQKYKDHGLLIVGMPCDQFLGQEPETNESMESVCQRDFGVTFQLTEKIHVNGADTHPVFKYLKKELGGFFGSRIKWNFTKFLIDSEGKPFKRYGPVKKPIDIEEDILSLLGMSETASA